MVYSTDCNYIIKVNDYTIIECFTKEQVKNNIQHASGCNVYKVLKDGSLEFMAKILPTNN